MALTEQDRESIELMATKINHGTLAAAKEMVEQMLEHHRLTCPAGQQILAGRRFLLGVLCGLGVLTAGGSAVGSFVAAWLKGT